MSSAIETAVPTIEGGFKIPQSPRRRLQDIQNNQASQPVAPLPIASADEQMRNGADAHSSIDANAQTSSLASEQTSIEANEQVREQALTQSRNQGSMEASARSSNQVSEQGSKQSSNRAIKEASTQVAKRGSNQSSGRVSAQASDDAESVEARVREMLALKRTLPGGTKGSVDMDPTLMKRVKRYLLDNGDPSFRVLVIELVEAFLEKEGY